MTRFATPARKEGRRVTGPAELYRVLPFEVRPEGPTIPLAVLGRFWDALEASGRDKLVFWGGDSFGDVMDRTRWFRFLFQMTGQLVFVGDLERKALALFAWLSTYTAAGAAWAHFCGLSCTRGAGRAILRYWDGFQDDKGAPLFKYLFGAIPESPSHLNALRAAYAGGFRVFGRVPPVVSLLHEGGRRVAQVLVYRRNPQVADAGLAPWPTDPVELLGLVSAFWRFVESPRHDPAARCAAEPEDDAGLLEAVNTVWSAQDSIQATCSQSPTGT